MFNSIVLCLNLARKAFYFMVVYNLGCKRTRPAMYK